jgi:hypothetical protein
MAKKLNLFDYDDPELGKVMIKEKEDGSSVIEVKIQGNQWQDVSEYNGPNPTPPTPDAEFGLFRGSRWVYINGKWYKIG